MKKLGLFLFIIADILLETSCEHVPLYDMDNTHYLRIYINDSIRNINKDLYGDQVSDEAFKLPEVMRVLFCDQKTGNVVSERFLQHSGRDEHGYYLDGEISVMAGDYHLMAYNFGSETTQIANDDNYYKISAFTNHISPTYYPKLPPSTSGNSQDYDKQNILYDPDNLWIVKEEGMKVRDHMNVDTLRAANGSYYKAETIVETYYMEIKITGASWVRSTASLLTGMAGGKRLYDGKLISDPPAIIYFEMRDRDELTKVLANSKTIGDKARAEDKEAVLYARFNSWGNLQDIESYFRVVFSFGVAGGGNQTETMDIKYLFTNEDFTLHRWIIIDKKIDIKEPEGIGSGGGGGFEPGVDNWEDEETDIIL